MNSLGLAMMLTLSLGQATPTDISPKLESAFAKSIAYEKQQQNADAIKALTELTGPDQSSYYTQLRLGWLNYSSAKYTEAETAYKAALQALPKATEAKLGLVLVLLAQLRFADAETLSKEVLAQDPGNYYANLRLAYALRNQLKFDQAETVNKLLLERYPTDVSVLLEAGLVKVGQKNKEAADQIFRRVLLLDADNVIANQQLGRTGKKKAG
jgi:tetratricopeptide (TPR) repeat protein